MTWPRVLPSGGLATGGVQEVELDQVEVPGVQDQVEDIAEVGANGRVRHIERVEETAPALVVTSLDEASVVLGKEPVAMIAQQVRCFLGDKGRQPQAGFVAAPVDCIGHSPHPVREFGIGYQPIADGMLPPVVDLEGIERDLVFAERVEVVLKDFLRDVRVVVVPACPAGQRWRPETSEAKEVEIAAERLAVRSSSHIHVVQDIWFCRYDSSAFLLEDGSSRGGGDRHQREPCILSQ